jgi:predicted aspartyl protease
MNNPTMRTRLAVASMTVVMMLVLAAQIAAKAQVGPSYEVALKEEGGTFVVPVQINGAITLDFTVDSGAADVQIPFDVFWTLVRAKTIVASDFIGEQTYTLADGSTQKQRRFIVRELKVGGYVLRNVPASVSPPESALLLGESFLCRFAQWTLDNEQHVLKLVEKSAEPVLQTPATSSLAVPQTEPAPTQPAPQQPAHPGRWCYYDNLRGYSGPFHSREEAVAYCKANAPFLKFKCEDSGFWEAPPVQPTDLVWYYSDGQVGWGPFHTYEEALAYCKAYFLKCERSRFTNTTPCDETTARIFPVAYANTCTFPAPPPSAEDLQDALRRQYQPAAPAQPQPQAQAGCPPHHFGPTCTAVGSDMPDLLGGEPFGIITPPCSPTVLGGICRTNESTPASIFQLPGHSVWYLHDYLGDSEFHTHKEALAYCKASSIKCEDTHTIPCDEAMARIYPVAYANTCTSGGMPPPTGGAAP